MHLIIGVSALAISFMSAQAQEMSRREFKKLVDEKKQQDIKTAEIKPLENVSRPPTAEDLKARYSYVQNKGKRVSIPTASLLYVPEGLSSMVTKDPTGTLVTWKSFLKQNRSKIHCHTVSLEEVRAQKRFTEEMIRGYKSFGKIVIATYKDRPISVNSQTLEPLQEPETSTNQ
jgi:hypothetical protein